MNPINKLPDAIIFDCGDTLINILNFDFSECFNYFYEEIIDQSKISKEDFLKYNKSIMHVFFERELNDIEVLFENYFNFITFTFGNVSNKPIEVIENECSHRLYQSKPVKDVTLFLDYCKSQNIPMYVLSNSLFSTREIRKELEENNLSHYFKEIISSGDHLYRKPSKDFFNLYLLKLKLDGITGNICYIGNSKKMDIETPIKLNMFAILLNEKLDTDFVSHDDYLEVQNYKTLIKLLKG